MTKNEAVRIVEESIQRHPEIKGEDEMSELKGKELELAIMEQRGRKQTPAEKMVDQVECHLIEADLILQALLDVADAGRKEMEGQLYDHGERFVVIHELLEKYRKGHSDFIKALYLEKKKAA